MKAAAAAATILIFDDATLLRELIAAALAAAGYRVRCAQDVREAREAVRTQRPAVVLLEPIAGGGAGLQFLREMRADKSLAPIPVIVLTSVGGRDQVIEVVRLRVKDYLLKNRSSVKQLLDRLDRAARGEPVATAPAAAAAAKPAMAAAPSTPDTATAARPGNAPPGGPLLTREACIERAHSALQARTLSGAVAQVIALATSPRSGLAQLSDLIAHDSVLSAKVLNAANSAAYAGSSRGPIMTIPDAVRRIGCATIRNIAAAVGVFDAMPETAPDGFNPIRSWQHSFAVARLCEQLCAREAPDRAGTAYLAGLCHDLGEILFRTHFGGEYARVLEAHAAGLGTLPKLEREMLGITQHELSLTILRCLALPAEIREPIESLHASGGGNGDDALGRILRLANVYANGMLLAASGGSPISPITRADARNASGEDAPQRPEADTFRGEVIALTSLLSRLSPAHFAPLHARQKVKLWLARDAGLSAFDPLHAALQSLAEIIVADHLPAPGQGDDCVGLIVAARSLGVLGLDATSIAAAAARPHDPTAGERPVLWLVPDPAAVEQTGQPLPPNIRPRQWTVTIDELAAFVQQCAAPAAAPTVSTASTASTPLVANRAA